MREMRESIFLSGVIALKNLVKLEKAIVRMNKRSKSGSNPNSLSVSQAGHQQYGALALNASVKLHPTTDGKTVNEIRAMFTAINGQPNQKK